MSISFFTLIAGSTGKLNKYVGCQTEFKGIFIMQMKFDKIVINKVSEAKNYIDEDDELLVLGNNSYYYFSFQLFIFNLCLVLYQWSIGLYL